jgi:hypothetical protein
MPILLGKDELLEKLLLLWVVSLAGHLKVPPWYL